MHCNVATGHPDPVGPLGSGRRRWYCDRMIKSGMLRLARHVARMNERCIQNDPWRRGKYNVKMSYECRLDSSSLRIMMPMYPVTNMGSTRPSSRLR